MSQRISGYARVPNENYVTTAAWPVAALLAHLSDVAPAWDPCAASGALVANLNVLGIEAIGTVDDFLSRRAPPPGVRSLITNPPYGEQRKGEKAVAFIRHALALEIPVIAFLLPSDFDSAIRGKTSSGTARASTAR
jgi:predicted RNA methylase